MFRLKVIKQQQEEKIRLNWQNKTIEKISKQIQDKTNSKIRAL